MQIYEIIIAMNKNEYPFSLSLPVKAMNPKRTSKEPLETPQKSPSGSQKII